VVFLQNSFAQELYTPRNIKKPYSNGSRSKDQVESIGKTTENTPWKLA
jgi:hypothetical protein